jgi:hypothetical protein
MVCEVLGLAVSSLYYTAREREEAELVQAIEEIATRYPRYGSRRISKQLAREPYFMKVNRKRVQSTFARTRLGCADKTEQEANNRQPSSFCEVSKSCSWIKDNQTG